MLMLRETGKDGATAHAHARLVDGSDDPRRAEWQELAADASEPNAFLEPWFALPALRHLRGQTPIWQIEVEADGRLIGLMHLTVHDGYGRMPVRYIGNWAHYQCFMGTPLVRSGYEEPFWKALLTLLDGAGFAPNFLSCSGLERGGPVHGGLMATGRDAAIVHAHERAMLASDVTPDAYLEAALRGKKRKELRRLANRLAELGTVSFRVYGADDDLAEWCDAFLALEAAGWKGSEGAALNREGQTAAFFRDMMAGAAQAGRLDFQRLDLDGRPIAMLVNFLTPPGSWSFKIAFDESLARFSPGVMIELENLPRVLGNPGLDWMDSCAVENHPMIDKLWRERREIVQITVPLAGFLRRTVHALCRTAETGSAFARSILSRHAKQEPDHD